MSIDLDLSAVKSAAKNSAANPWLMANVANVANLANEKQPNNHQSAEKLATLAGLATLAISQTPANAEKAPTVAPALDPGLHRLLALAMAYCNHTGASDKARADWHADIAATPVEQRGELAAYLQSQLPAPSLKAQAPTVAPDTATKPMPAFHQAQEWRKADREFQAHYWQCPECKAGGRTRGPLCPTGAELHQQYEQAAMATEGASQ